MRPRKASSFRHASSSARVAVLTQRIRTQTFPQLGLLRKSGKQQGGKTMKGRCSNRLLSSGSIFFAAMTLTIVAGLPNAYADIVSDAKAAVERYSGPQTKWEGPTTAPKPDKGKKVVFLSGDEQNDISHLYGTYIKEAGEKLGWEVTIIDGKGSPTS